MWELDGVRVGRPGHGVPEARSLGHSDCLPGQGWGSADTDCPCPQTREKGRYGKDTEHSSRSRNRPLWPMGDQCFQEGLLVSWKVEEVTGAPPPFLARRL